MSKMGEKVAYLKGLAEGLGVNAQTEQGKLMMAIIDTLDAFADQIEDNEEELEELKEYVEEIDNDVCDLEDAIFSDEDEEFSSAEKAIAREKQLKNWHREWKENLIKQLNPNFEDLSRTIGVTQEIVDGIRVQYSITGRR